MYVSFLIYTVLTYPIRFLFLLASFISKRAKKFRDIRIKSLQEFNSLRNDKQFLNAISIANTYWFHGASVGEIEQAKSMGLELKKREPNCYLIISWISDSVTDRNLNDSPADFHIPLPIDSPHSYNNYFQVFKPIKVLIFSWDTWIWFIHTAKKYGSKVYLVCATLNENYGRREFLFRQLRKLQYSLLDGIYPTHVFHERRFQSLLNTLKHPPPIESLGDTRFESVISKMNKYTPSTSFQEFEKIWMKKNSKNEKPLVFASTYEICEKGICKYLRSYYNSKKTLPMLWIFPHKIDKNRLKYLQLNLNNCLDYSSSNSPLTGLFSEIIQNNYFDRTKFNSLPPIILFDEMGILAYAYKYAKFAYVGGAFHHRIHNTLEPSYWSLPLISGSHIQNASEAVVLREMGGLIATSSIDDLSGKLIEMSTWSLEKLNEIGKINRNFVIANKGASSRIYQRLWR